MQEGLLSEAPRAEGRKFSGAWVFGGGLCGLAFMVAAFYLRADFAAPVTAVADEVAFPASKL